MKSRDINIYKSYKGEIDMKQKCVKPKKGRGSMYSRKIKHKNKIEYN